MSIKWQWLCLIKYAEKSLTLASNACLNISHNALAKLSDFPVSVAYKIVHLTLLAIALDINFVENLTALLFKIEI